MDMARTPATTRSTKPATVVATGETRALFDARRGLVLPTRDREVGGQVVTRHRWFASERS